MQHFVTYYRVSTKKQGESGLGLAAQKNIVEQFAKPKGKIIAEFTEIESGKKRHRLELEKAISYTKDHHAVLLIAKLDRLSRDVEFIFSLKNSGINFVCADMPEMNTLTIGIFAVMAQHEREMISKRTKEALAAKKRLGFSLGSPKNLTRQAQCKGAQMQTQKAKGLSVNKQAFAVIRGLREQGFSFLSIAQKLNDCGLHTAKGKQFHAITVQRIYRMFNNTQLDS
ncbi:MAG: recombinase family protein [Nitrospirae bacterium]|nr:recombinase family protein [Nitrospirota bacterium]